MPPRLTESRQAGIFAALLCHSIWSSAQRWECTAVIFRATLRLTVVYVCRVIWSPSFLSGFKSAHQLLSREVLASSPCTQSASGSCLGAHNSRQHVLLGLESDPVRLGNYED